MAVKQVTGSDRHGWLDVRIDGIADITSLPYSLSVDTLGVSEGREKFKVREGIRKNMTGSVKLTPSGGSQFGSVAHRRAGSVSFSLSTGKVTFGELSINALSAITDPSNPVPIGTWTLQIPDEKHPGGFGYYGRSRHASVWFRIGDGRDRYLHPGRNTAGCVTVTDVENWTTLCEYLMIARKGDGMNVGTIQVTR